MKGLFLILFLFFVTGCWELGHIGQYDIQSPTPEEMIGWVNYPDVYVEQIVEDSKGTLWFSGVMGNYVPGIFKSDLFKFDGKNWNKILPDEIGIGDSIRVTTLYSDSRGKVYVGLSNNGLAVYESSNWKIYSQNDGLISNQINCITVDQSDNLWIGTDAGLMRFNGVKWDTFTISDGLPSNTIYEVKDGKNNSILVLTSKGFAIFDQLNWRVSNPDTGIKFFNFYKIVKDRQGNLWVPKITSDIITAVGFHIYNGISWNDVNIGKSSWIAYSFDFNNDIWLENSESHPDGGVAYLKNGVWCEIYSYASGLAPYNDSDGNSGLLHNGIGEIFIDSKNRKWFSTYLGVSVYEL